MLCCNMSHVACKSLLQLIVLHSCNVAGYRKEEPQSALHVQLHLKIYGYNVRLKVAKPWLHLKASQNSQQNVNEQRVHYSCNHFPL